MNRVVRLALAAIAAAVVMAVIPQAAYACDTDTGAAADGLITSVECSAKGTVSEGGAAIENASGERSFDDYRWATVCLPFDPANDRGFQAMECAAARDCPDPTERVWNLWGERVPPATGWELLYTQCFGRPPTTADAPRPTVTPGRVLTALRQIGLPALEAKTQPAGKTLVNFETIFYAEPQPFTRTITLLGQSVDVEATPATYTWHHGDGTTASTETPGARYPAKDVVHEYTDAHTTVSPSVDVTYTARFRVNGGAWQDIPETVTITGPGGSLRIAEATAVLSGSYR